MQILSVGSALPDHQVDLDLATRSAQSMSCSTQTQSDKVAKLYRRTGVVTRQSVLLEKASDGSGVTQSFYPPMSESECGPTTKQRNDRFGQDAPPLAVHAGSQALAASGCDSSQVTHLITVTCTGFNAPGIDIELIERLSLPATTQRLQIGFMGCHALINALRAARGLVAADTGACVLIVCIELCSLHYQYGYDAQRIVSGALFADGSAGLVVAGKDFKPSTASGQDTTLGEIAATGSCLIPNSRDAMTWLIGDHGFQMTLQATVPGLIEENLRSFLEPWLRSNHETLDSIGGWAVHPGGSRVLQAVQTALGFSDDALEISRNILRDHGNVSSATLGLVLQQFIANKIPRPWLMLGFGPGLEIEVALIR